MLEVFSYLDWEMILRLIIAGFLGLMIGLERELKRKALGLKTILVISIVSCLLTIVSIQTSYILPESDNLELRMDPLRLAAQIISGVGFLGAGVILRRGDDSISGLTTAAIVWGAAGIGITVGAGFYIEAFIGVGLLLFSVKLIPALIARFQFKKLNYVENLVHLTIRNKDDIPEIIRQIENEFKEIDKISIKDNGPDTHVIEFLILVHATDRPTTTYTKLKSISGIELVHVQT